MVAPSYQKLKTLSEPFEESGRSYIFVQMKNGNEKKVRYYTAQEYKKKWPDSPIEEKDRSADPYYKPQKDLLGFQYGSIWILRDPTPELENELYLKGYLYSTRHWDRFIRSEEKKPEGYDLVELPWEEVGNPDGKLKPEEEVALAVERARHGEDQSEWAAAIGDRIDADLEVMMRKDGSNQWGSTALHIFQDSLGYWYSWQTSAKSLEIGRSYRVKGTVKELKILNGRKTTVLTRCRVNN